MGLNIDKIIKRCINTVQSNFLECTNDGEYVQGVFIPIALIIGSNTIHERHSIFHWNSSHKIIMLSNLLMVFI